jgi:hypothetical protein
VAEKTVEDVRNVEDGKAAGLGPGGKDATG